MSFYQYYLAHKDFDFNSFFSSITTTDIERILAKDKINAYDFLSLLSPQAEKHLESMAEKAQKLSLQHFGKAILLFTPMYIANHCINKCAYCGFNVGNRIKRKKLTAEEIEQEAKAIAATGLRHILFLTGESPAQSPVSYIAKAAGILKKHFHSVGIEIYPLTEQEYSQVIDAGVDSLTVYQEVYDEGIYDKVHLAGPKRNYSFRLDAPERACRAKIRSVNIGALLGLNEWCKEAFFTGLHADYLQNKYPDVAVSVSLPRIRPHAGTFQDIFPVNDKSLVQIMLALRIFLPYTGITISTRERQEYRDHLIPLGVTKMSAGVSTEVGGHSSEDKGEGQFEIADNRNVAKMKQAILAKGYQPVSKDWMSF
ncbi:2-iminoacetate synthase ThiH [Metallumcola ferriviriculae]|uniref:2-iminoacetate synthase ThiH n=1 Tax=Metallumcola ferriviriculae TaxID=3039180 RepID=A0AAU0ULI0_9FIRM|nr:2-iminoacetate synthase ThiH [Desulfitibacteraceae bacterium MK1]